jgi:hypothetical protein
MLFGLTLTDHTAARGYRNQVTSERASPRDRGLGRFRASKEGGDYQDYFGFDFFW